MIVSIHQPQYLPWLGYFDKIVQADVFVVLDDVQFKKNEWQNRNRIRTAEGWQWLTVPVLHDFGQAMSEVGINNAENWRDKHLKALELNYRKAPYFQDYFGFFEKIYQEKWDKLIDINLRFILQLVHLLGIETKIVLSSQYKVREERTERLVDLCRHFQADTYLSGAGGEQYLDVGAFVQSGMKVMFQKYEHPAYPQQWVDRTPGGFISHLSIIDLLFNCGKDSVAVLSHRKNAP